MPDIGYSKVTLPPPHRYHKQDGEAREYFVHEKKTVVLWVLEFSSHFSSSSQVRLSPYRYEKTTASEGPDYRDRWVIVSLTLKSIHIKGKTSKKIFTCTGLYQRSV